LHLTSLIDWQNFALNIYSAQIMSAQDTNSAQVHSSLDRFDTLFVFFFTAELGINIFCRWFWPFIKNPWCMFDLLIVSASLISLAPTGLPFDLLLLFRCSRVLRAVGRFKTVRRIFNILMRSIVPMASAFFLIFTLTSICEDDLISGVCFIHHVLLLTTNECSLSRCDRRRYVLQRSGARLL
jgi:hypothetical protein